MSTHAGTCDCAYCAAVAQVDTLRRAFNASEEIRAKLGAELAAALSQRAEADVKLARVKAWLLDCGVCGGSGKDRDNGTQVCPWCFEKRTLAEEM